MRRDQSIGQILVLFDPLIHKPACVTRALRVTEQNEATTLVFVRHVPFEGVQNVAIGELAVAWSDVATPRQKRDLTMDRGKDSTNARIAGRLVQGHKTLFVIRDQVRVGRGINTQGRVDVEAIKLRISRPLVHLDLEGVEYRALLGANATLGRAPNVLFENDHLDEGGRIYDHLDAMGFAKFDEVEHNELWRWASLVPDEEDDYR